MHSPTIFMLPSSNPLQFSRTPSSPQTLTVKPSSYLAFLVMKDPPSPSYGTAYVSPPHLVHSVITSPSLNSAASIGSKIRVNHSSGINNKSDNGTLQHLETQTEELYQMSNSQFKSADDDLVIEEGSDRENDTSSRSVRLCILNLFGV